MCYASCGTASSMYANCDACRDSCTVTRDRLHGFSTCCQLCRTSSCGRVAVTLSVPNQQFPPANTTTTETTDDNFPHIFLSCCLGFCRHRSLVHSLQMNLMRLYNRIHQEQIVAGKTTQHREMKNPVVQERVIVQEIPQAPQVVDSSPILGDVAARESTCFCFFFFFSRNSTGSVCGFTDGTQCELHVDQQRCACHDRP